MVPLQFWSAAHSLFNKLVLDLRCTQMLSLSVFWASSVHVTFTSALMFVMGTLSLFLLASDFEVIILRSNCFKMLIQMLVFFLKKDIHSYAALNCSNWFKFTRCAAQNQWSGPNDLSTCSTIGCIIKKTMDWECKVSYKVTVCSKCWISAHTCGLLHHHRTSGGVKLHSAQLEM